MGFKLVSAELRVSSITTRPLSPPRTLIIGLICHAWGWSKSRVFQWIGCLTRLRVLALHFVLAMANHWSILQMISNHTYITTRNLVCVWCQHHNLQSYSVQLYLWIGLRKTDRCEQNRNQFRKWLKRISLEQVISGPCPLSTFSLWVNLIKIEFRFKQVWKLGWTGFST